MSQSLHTAASVGFRRFIVQPDGAGGRTIIMIRRTCIALALAPNPSFRSHPKPIANSMQSYLQCLDHMLIPSVLVVL